MSEPSYVHAGNHCPTPMDSQIDAPASNSDTHSLDLNPIDCNNALHMDLSYDNDNDLLSSIDIFESVTDSSSYGGPSPTSLDQETDCLGFGDFPGLSEDVHIQGSTFTFKDDTCGAISTEDESEEFCAKLAEEWVEEQMHKEDLGCVSAPNGSDNSLYTAFSEPGCAKTAERRCQSKSSASLKSPRPIPGSLNPITPVQPNITSTKSGHRRAKRTVSEVSNSSSTHKPGKRRNAKSQAQTPSFRSQSRIRMDNALKERCQAQVDLREALVNLKKAQALERECRARYASATLLVKTTAEKECEALLREDTSWNKMFRQLKKMKDETGGCIVKQVEDNKSPEMARLVAWMCKNRKDCKLNGKSSKPSLDRNSSTSDAVVSQENSAASGQAAIVAPEEHDDSSIFEDLDPESILADPYKKIALDSIGFDYDPRASRWNDMYEQLKAFKATHGTTLVPHANQGLGAWVKRQQVQYNLYNSGRKSDLTEKRVRLLNDLDFVWSRRSNTWNENFQRLKRWSEEHGSCQIPDGTDDPELVALSKWIAELRAQYKRQISEDSAKECDDNDEPTTKKKSKKKLPKLCPEQIEALKSIGFELDARHAKWLQKFDVLIQYYKKHGDFLVPSNYKEDPTLFNWIAYQRQQYKLYQKGSKSNMSERRLKILTDAGFPFSSKEEMQKKKDEAFQQDIDDFDAKPWLENYKDLLLHIAKHGSVDSLQKNNPMLWDWVGKQRQELFQTSSDSESTDATETHDPPTKEHVSLMKAADSFASCLAAESAEGHNASANKEISSWDCLFGTLAAWYIKHGTYSIKGMPAKLKKFMSKQQEHHRLLCSGSESELTPDRLEKLNGIYFPFDHQTPNECSLIDVAATRRNKSWEEFRLDLAIRYIQKGNYDMQAIDDLELRRWATEQKRQHKLYLAGKQSSLSFTQVQRLIDIKFISKRPKQWSWPELCGDLMAFRIQFGSFDVANAKEVVNSSKPAPKGKSTLHNIRGLMEKLKTARHEFTQEQLLQLESVSFPWVEPAGTAITPDAVASSAQVTITPVGSAVTPIITASSAQVTAPPSNQAKSKPVTKNIFGMVLEMHTMTKQ